MCKKSENTIDNPISGKNQLNLDIINPDAFDFWLKKELKNLYGKILAEPIPQNLLDMINQNKDKK